MAMFPVRVPTGNKWLVGNNGNRCSHMQFELQLATHVGDMAKIIRFPFLDMTFITFQERACIL